MKENQVDLKIKGAHGKAPLNLLQLRALVGASRVRAYGDRKYNKGNWLYAPDTDETYERYVGAAMRHLYEMQGPAGSFSAINCTERDRESGLPHLDHAIVSLIMLRELLIHHGHMSPDPGPGKDIPPSRAQK